jgi:hypothetical protein
MLVKNINLSEITTNLLDLYHEVIYNRNAVVHDLLGSHFQDGTGLAPGRLNVHAC